MREDVPLVEEKRAEDDGLSMETQPTQRSLTSWYHVVRLARVRGSVALARAVARRMHQKIAGPFGSSRRHVRFKEPVSDSVHKPEWPKKNYLQAVQGDDTATDTDDDGSLADSDF